MSTRAQDFRNEVEHNTHKSKQIHARVAIEPRYSHNDAHRADAKATYAIEEPQGDPRRVSRKSTRKSSNRIKTDAALTNLELARIAAPKNRHSAKRH